MHIIMISMISMCTYSITIYTLSEYLFTIYVLSNEHQPFTSLSKCLAWRDGLRRWRDRHAGYFLGWGQAGIRKNCVFEWGLLKIHSVWDLWKKQPVLYWQYSLHPTQWKVVSSLCGLSPFELVSWSCFTCLNVDKEGCFVKRVSFLMIEWSYWMIETSQDLNPRR